MPRFRLLSMLTLAVPLLNGCAMVGYHQQARLQMPDMRFDHDQQGHAVIQHIHTAREASVGGFGSEGAGGCGAREIGEQSQADRYGLSVVCQ